VLSLHAELAVSVLLRESAFASVAIRANLRNIRDVSLHTQKRDNWRVITRLVLVGKWRKLTASLEVGRTDWHTHAWQRISLMLLVTHCAEVALLRFESFLVVVVAQEIEVFSRRIWHCHFCW